MILVSLSVNPSNTPIYSIEDVMPAAGINANKAGTKNLHVSPIVLTTSIAVR